MSDEKKDIAKAVGHIPSGLFIVCALNPDSKQIDGFLGSWIQQVSFDPLLVSLCIKPGRPASDQILEKGIFSINIVGEHNKGYLKSFWSGYDPNKKPFADIPHTVTEQGAVVINGAKSTIICQLQEHHKPGDHDLIIAKVLASIVNEEEAPSMVHLRKSGLDY